MELKFFDSKDFKTGLKISSMSDQAAAQRQSVYKGAIENLDTLAELNRRMRMFDAGLQGEAVQNMAPSAMGVALAEATLKAQVNSILGYVAIERSMSQMTQMLVYRDIITKSGAMVMPMIGKDNPRSRAQQVFNSSLSEGETAYSVSFGEAIVAGSLAINVTLGDKSIALMDDRKGNILAPGGILAAGSIDYQMGELTLEFSETIPAESKIRACYAVNKTMGQGDKRTTIKQGYFQIAARINKFEYEADLITAMISQKTVGGDVIADLQQSVYDEQVLSINGSLVNSLKDNYAGNTMNIDLSQFSIAGGFFDTLLKYFNAGLASVDNALASRCYKIVAANAYMVGNGLATLFMSLEDAQGWVPNNTGYVNGVIGFYKGRAVIRHLDLEDFEGYAIHKTADNQVAPLGYGILLPATNLPLVGNFANTNEVAGGLYSVDGTNTVALDLAQRFVVSMPADWFMLAQ